MHAIFFVERFYRQCIWIFEMLKVDTLKIEINCENCLTSDFFHCKIIML